MCKITTTQKYLTIFLHLKHFLVCTSFRLVVQSLTVAWFPKYEEIVTEKVTIICLVGAEKQNEAAVHQRENLNQETDNECGKYFFLLMGGKASEISV